MSCKYSFLTLLPLCLGLGLVYSSTLQLNLMSFSLFLSLLYYAIISISLSFPGEEKGLCLFSLVYFISFHYHFTYYIYPFQYPFPSSHVPTFLLLPCPLLTPVLSPHWHFQSVLHVHHLRVGLVPADPPVAHWVTALVQLVAVCLIAAAPEKGEIT